MGDELVPTAASTMSHEVFRRTVFQLALEGQGLIAIAASLGSDPDTVKNAIEEMLEYEKALASDQRLLSARLDFYLRSVMAGIHNGSFAAINTALKIEALRISLFGLARLPPPKPVTTGGVYFNGKYLYPSGSDEDTHLTIGGVNVEDFT